MNTIINPETGRPIKVGGKTHKVPYFQLVEYLTKEFIEFKLCYNESCPLIIFPGTEKFVDTVIDDFAEKMLVNFNE